MEIQIGLSGPDAQRQTHLLVERLRSEPEIIEVRTLPAPVAADRMGSWVDAVSAFVESAGGATAVVKVLNTYLQTRVPQPKKLKLTTAAVELELEGKIEDDVREMLERLATQQPSAPDGSAVPNPE